ncbi:16S rRNA (uracil(1498)-N(3))-methyltransferase [Salipaludibacillus agaradhaerens]|uniref:16S rRNA (uracil(1498)-N(3))-methyltransferase n=1 Tax=Salipaludibacillus agaradhaerens TaxID=76935 RepID=UPI002151B16B|nr:16S rRNA (uracil(1498)-N(3))-methyltransferase [Salipaludibacillus agaradhaerens]MCR6106303.1 16S rRNA (uracil(1498)-N(3))-methyltransferase [Salipaludibacillus agaradhaerens]MCR6118336.1 16S rRNA (uracil(1498)-N(3))-methyltransferase [Salipaludibacillus agaradhaerens]
MQRYFLNKAQFHDKQVLIDGETARHISKVMRMAPGDNIICCDGEGACHYCTLEKVSADDVRATITKELSDNVELPVKVTIAHGLPKGDKLELVIQKATELGASGFIPFQAERSVVKLDKKKELKKIERWRKIAKEASEQSHRQLMPRIEAVHSISALIDQFSSYSSVILAYEEDAKQHKNKAFHQSLSLLKPQDNLLFIVGPEGGFTDKEVTMMQNAGAISCSLGPRILRSETAPLYGLSAISFYFELSG